MRWFHQNVDCIYVGTPHSHHYANVYACLSAGKNVLCEKSLTVNAPQASALIDLARSKNLFFMEAVWTRFQPYAYKLQEVIESGAIGQVRAVQAELCADFGPTAKENPDHRLVNPYLAGGALLDLGPYPWTQLALTLLPRSKASSEPLPVPKVAASMTKTSSGVDASVVAAIEFKQEDGRIVQGTFTAAQDRHSIEHRCVLVQGSKGFIEVAFPTYRPRKFTVYRYENEQQMGDLEVQPETDVYQFEPRAGDCWGFVWEADEVARCLRDGKKESDRMPLRETLLMMQVSLVSGTFPPTSAQLILTDLPAQVFDEMRKQGSFVYPEQLETLELS